MQLALESLLHLFDSFHAGTRYHCLANFVPTTGTTTFTANSADVVVSGGHNLVLGNRIRFSGSPPAPLNTTTTYYVVEVVNTTTFRIATTPTGSAITITDDGSATYRTADERLRPVAGVGEARAECVGVQQGVVHLPECCLQRYTTSGHLYTSLSVAHGRQPGVYPRFCSGGRELHPQKRHGPIGVLAGV